MDASFRSELTPRLERVPDGGLATSRSPAPCYVPLDIVLTVCVAPGHFRGTVSQPRCSSAFSTRDLPGGGRGFFHPDNFTFAAAGLPQRRDRRRDGGARGGLGGRPGRPASSGSASPRPDELAAGLIAMDRLEVARCDSEPPDPAAGRIDFDMSGGL